MVVGRSSQLDEVLTEAVYKSREFCYVSPSATDIVLF